MASVQLPANELKQLTSIVNVQTKGVKKFMELNNLNSPREAEIDDSNESEQKRWSSIAGKKRRERLALLHGFVLEIMTFSQMIACQSNNIA